MALQAYPDVPLFRYPYTDLSEAQISAALAAAGRVGPGGKGLDNNLSGKVLNFAGDGGNKLSWAFGTGNRVALGGKEAGYGSLDLGRLTLFAHIVPGTTTAYAVAWDRESNAATVFELWFGGGPAPRARELNREVFERGQMPAVVALVDELDDAVMRFSRLLEARREREWLADLDAQLAASPERATGDRARRP